MSERTTLSDLPLISLIDVLYRIRFEEVKRARAARKGSRRARAVRMAQAAPHLLRVRIRIRLRARIRSALDRTAVASNLTRVRTSGAPNPNPNPNPNPERTEGGGHQHERSSGRGPRQVQRGRDLGRYTEIWGDGVEIWGDGVEMVWRCSGER